MNYRHGYHAGNFADIFKHVVLCALIEALQRKSKPYAVLDTHAGERWHDLTGERATRTGEAATGILPFMAARVPAEPALSAIARYHAIIRSLNDTDALTRAPGSAHVAHCLARPGDRVIACDLHPETARTLKAQAAMTPPGQPFGAEGRDRIAVHHRDGYEAMKALLPFAERRGIILVDPPFEAADEFDRMSTAVLRALKRFPTGIFALWHPIKDRNAAWRFQEGLIERGVPRTLQSDFLIQSDGDWSRLTGCGMTIVNPPWQLDRTLDAVLPRLLTAIGAADAGAHSVRWLVDPDD